MPLEVTRFETNIGDWLGAIEGVTSLVPASRILNGEPLTPPTYPLVTFDMSRRPVSDVPAPAWTGQLTVEVQAMTKAELNAVEDAIETWLQDAANDVNDTLSTSGSLRVQFFQLVNVPPDGVMVDVREDDTFHVRLRALVFDFLLVGLGET